MTDLIRRGAFKGDHANADDMYDGAGKINDFAATQLSLNSQIISAGDVRFAPLPTSEARIEAACVQAEAELKDVVFVPATMTPHDPTLIGAHPTIRRVREGGDFSTYDVQAYGADPLGVIDAGPSWNACRAAIPASGGPMRVPFGAYKLTTAFTYAAQTNVRLFIDAGVTLTGQALPLAVGTNLIVDYRGGFQIIGGAARFATDDATQNATIWGVRNVPVTGSAILVKFAALAGGPSIPNGAQVGAFGIEAVGANWNTDAATAAFVQIIPGGGTTLITALRIQASSSVDVRILPKNDNLLSIGDDVDDAQPGNTYGRRLADVRAYNITAVGGASAPTIRGQRINVALTSPVSGDALVSVEGQGWAGVSGYVKGGYVSFNATENWNSTNWGTQMRIGLAPVGGGVPVNRFVFNADVFRGAVDNTQDIGLSSNRIKNVFGYIADFTTKLNINNTQVVTTRKTGWAAWTGTAARGTQNADAPPTTTQVAQALKALIDDLISHGLIGT